MSDVDPDCGQLVELEHHEAAHMQERSAKEIAALFKMRSQLLATVECRVANENKSLKMDADAGACIHLFESHVCIEQTAFMLFTKRKAIPLTDIIGLTRPPGVVGQARRGMKVVDLQMHGHSIRLTMDAEQSDTFARKVEMARLKKAHEKRTRDLADFDEEDSDGSTMPSVGKLTEKSVYIPKHQHLRSNSQINDISSFMLSSSINDAPTQHGVETENDSKGAFSDLFTMSSTEWNDLIGGARYRKYKRGAVVLDVNTNPEGLVQLVSGTVRVEQHIPGRTMALRVGRHGPGEILGTTSFLLGELPFARVVCESDEAATVRLPNSHIDEIFDANPSIAGKFYFLLAQQQAKRLQQATNDSSSPTETMLSSALNPEAPKCIDEVVSNQAYLMIFHRFIQADPRLAQTYLPMTSFLYEVRALHRYSKGRRLPKACRNILDRFISDAAASSIYKGLNATLAQLPSSQLASPVSLSENSRGVGGSQRERAKVQLSTAAVEALRSHLETEVTSKMERVTVRSGLAFETSAYQLRHAFDQAAEMVLNALELGCMPPFLQSSHYEYVLNLIAKRSQPVSQDHFRLVRFLGQGAFGTVMEVVKRDCSKRYAMKLVAKQHLASKFDDGVWQAIMMTELTILKGLNHPLLINLAYSFQNVDYLFLVMDVCRGGDLERFGIDGDAILNSDQVRFVGIEVVAILSYLRVQKVLFRDLKPANLLVDESGHLRLVDFGASKRGARNSDTGEYAEPLSAEECGTAAYMAPEARFAEQLGIRYSYSVDYFSFGVMLYELTEKTFPFGRAPRFQDLELEFRQPTLAGPDGQEIAHMYDLLTGLLDWDAGARLGATSGDLRDLTSHPYWNAPDWDLAGRRLLISPLQASALAATRPSQHAPQKERLAEKSKRLAEKSKELAEKSRGQGRKMVTDLMEVPTVSLGETSMAGSVLEMSVSMGGHQSFMPHVLATHERQLSVETVDSSGSNDGVREQRHQDLSPLLQQLGDASRNEKHLRMRSLDGDDIASYEVSERH